MAAILHRYQQFNKNVLPNIVIDRDYSDWNLVSYWAKEAVKALTTQSILHGRPDGTFDPQGLATRAEIATVMMNIHEEQSSDIQ